MLNTESLTQIYQERVVLKGFSFSFAPNRIYGIIGPNGAGKSTLMRLISAMEKPYSGLIYYNGKVLEQSIPEIGCVWQKPYLFQTSVAENIAYGLRIRKWKARQRQARVDYLLKTFRLESLKDQWAPRLSVGEAARVAIARAVAPNSRILLLDEPTANLDPGNTRLVEEILAAVQTDEKMTIIIVTHDMFQAKRLAETTLFLANGELVESGPSARLFTSPANIITERFISGEL